MQVLGVPVGSTLGVDPASSRWMCRWRSKVFRVSRCSHSSHLSFCTQIRGVPVGSTLSVQPSLERVDVYVEMKEPTTVIPRNALIEANQSGLIAEPLIDITPQMPIPDWKVGCYASLGCPTLWIRVSSVCKLMRALAPTCSQLQPVARIVTCRPL